MTRLRWLVPVGAALSVVLASCKGGDRIVYPPPVAKTIALTVDRSTLTFIPGARDSVSATLTRGGGYNGAVTLAVEGLPAGVSTIVGTPGTSAASAVPVVFVAAANTAPGSFTATIRATGSGVNDATATVAITVQPTPAIALGAAPTALTINQTDSGTVALTLARTNYPGAVALSAPSLPAGITARFSEATTTGTTATVVIRVAANVIPAVYPITVNASGAGITTSLTTFNVTVAPAPAYTLTAAPGAITVPQGTSDSVSLAITRTNFAGAVTISTSGVPSGVTATIAPSSVSGTSARLQFTVDAAAPGGTYTIGVRGVAAGLTDRTVSVALTLLPVLTATIDFGVCAAADRPTWFAQQNGDGAWVRVTGNNNVYTLRMSDDHVAYAYTQESGAQSRVTVRNATRAELAGNTVRICAPPPEAAISVSGNLVGIRDVAAVFFGGARLISPGSGSRAFTMTGVRPGTFDLWAYTEGERGFVRRGVTPGVGGAVGAIDFAGPNSFAALDARGLVGGSTAGESIVASMGYLSGTGASACTPLQLTPLPFSAGEMEMFGVPAGQQLPTDFHQLVMQGTIGGTTNTRTLTESFQSLLTRVAQPFVLPAVQATPSVAVASGTTAYKRLQMVSAAVASEYNRDLTFSYVFGTKSIVQSTSALRRTGAGQTFVTPDFTATSGWNNAWVPASAETVTWTFELAGSNGALCQEGSRQVTMVLRGSR